MRVVSSPRSRHSDRGNHRPVPRANAKVAVSNSRKLVLIDANGLVYRAFFALPYFTTSSGRPTNAVYGFTNMLLKILDEELPNYVAAAFDKPAPTFRHRAYEQYKAHRERMPDDLRPQIKTAKEIVEALAIPIFELEGFEAEDILGTIARKASADGFDVLIVTGDLDTLQLVDERIKVMVTSRGITETTLYDPAKVMARFGITPAQMTDFKGLKGDTTDNIPGVPGIGEKTAAQLIQQFGTVEDLLEQLDRAPEKLKAKLQQHAEQVLQSKHLATIVTSVPIQWSWPDLTRKTPDRQRLQALFDELEFKSLLERVGVVEAQTAGSYSRVRDEEELEKIVRGTTELGVFLARNEGHPLAATVSGLALAPEPGRAHYLALPDAEIPPLVRGIMEDSSILKVSGDAKADRLTLRRLGIRPAGFDFDVAIASYLLNPGKRTHTVATAAWEFLKWRLRIANEEDGDKLALDSDEITDAGEVADASRRLRPVLEAQMREKEVYALFTDIEMPLVAVLAEMEVAGVAVDVGYLETLSGEMERRLADLTAEIYRLAGTEFNISSPKQLGFVLFEKLQLPALKRTKTGLSTDAEVLEYLAPQHAVVAKILEHRELTKLKTTYVDVLPKLLDPKSGRVHTTFNQTVAATGRVITTDPNLQNIPIRSEEGRKIRRAIIAAPGARLVGADYSQIDLRVLAHITEDPGLLGAFERDDDVHAVTASEIFGVPRSEVTPEQRRRAKTIVFGVAYGMSEFGLAAQLGLSKTEAKAYIDRYYAKYPRVRQYMLDIVGQVRRTGYVTTLLNRRRYIPEVHTRNRPIREAAERTAINTPIQGSTADIIKKAMIEIARDVLPRFPRAVMTLQVHDELLFEVPEGDVKPVADAAKGVMERAFPLRVPLRVDTKAGPNWRDMDPVS